MAVTERWITETLDDLALDIAQLRQLGKADIVIYSPFPIELEERSFGGCTDLRPRYTRYLDKWFEQDLWLTGPVNATADPAHICGRRL